MVRFFRQRTLNMQKRPEFSSAARAFKQVYDDVGKTVSGVGTLIGGRVNHNINNITPAQGQFQNACAIRMSYVLNKTGVKVPFIAGQTVSGGKGDWYIFRVRTMITHLRDIFGEPDLDISTPSASQFADEKGILVFDVEGWSDASGHATIWNGVGCSDNCYFSLAKKAYLWRLKD